MQIRCNYRKGEFIRMRLDGFDASDPICTKVKSMLEAKKFSQKLGSVEWQRDDFDISSNNTFEFWLTQASMLCKKFGENEPVELQDSPGSPSSDDVSPTDNNDTSTHQILALQQKVRLLEEEIEQLKKFDAIAIEQLKKLRE